MIMPYWRCERFSPNMRNACAETSFHVSSSMGEVSKAKTFVRLLLRFFREVYSLPTIRMKGPVCVHCGAI